MELVKLLKRPEGTYIFQYESPQLFNKDVPRGTLIQVPAGLHLFRLEREENFTLVFTHASPGTGTRIARLDIADLEGTPKLFICITWSPEKASLSAGSVPPTDTSLLTADSEPSKVQFIILNSEPNPAAAQIQQVGDEGVHTFGFRGYTDNRLTEEPSAINVWREATEAIRVLRAGSSDEGYIFEVVQASAIVSMLVTGLESYCQRRFVELEGEGISPDFASITNSSRLQRTVRSLGGPEVVLKRAQDAPLLLTRDLAAGINFQDYEQCKAAFRTGYHLSFSDDLDVSSDDLGEIRIAIRQRHQIAHVSPLMSSIITSTIGGSGDSRFLDRRYIASIEPIFQRFVDALHRGTLALRPPANPTR